MKRTPLRPGQPPRRSRELPRGSARSSLPRSGRLPSGNRARKAKKAARYKAFLSSAVWKRLRKAALERSGHQCETTMQCGRFTARCLGTEKLTVHHTTYARFGGDELPEDLEVKCKDCHDRHHALEGKRIA